MSGGDRPVESARTRVAVAIVAVLLVVGAAVALIAQVGDWANTSSYRLRVLRGGEELASFDISQIEAIGTRDIVLQGKNQHGPTLLGVLAKAGVTDFESLEIRGSGAKDTGLLTLKRDEVDGDVLLAVSNRGTVKVAGPNIPFAGRVRDVAEVTVR